MNNVEEFYLDNGLRVFLKEDKFSPVSSIFVWVNTGSAYENDFERGLAHVHEHMIFKGTEKLKVGEISKQIEAHGGEVNAFTSFDETVYYTTISNSFIDVGFDILSDCMSNATFNEDELAKELEVIIEEIKRGEDSPSSCLGEMIFKNTFPSHTYGLPIIGSRESVKSFKHKDVMNFYDKWYQAKNMNLIVVGGLNFEDMKRKITKAFKKIRSNEISIPSIEDRSNSPEIKLDVDYREVNETYFALSFKTTKATDLKSVALDIASHILGDGPSSLLNKQLKEELSLVTSIYSYNYSMRHCGACIIGGTLIKEKLEEALKIIIKNILKVINLDFDSNQFEIAKNSILSEELHTNETVQGQAQSIGYLQSLAGQLDFKEKYLEKVKNISIEEVALVAKEFFNPDNLNLNLIFPKDSSILEEKEILSMLTEAFSEEMTPFKNNFAEYTPKDYSLSSISSDKPNIIALKNGIKLIVFQNEKTPLLSLRSLSIGGSRFEDPLLNGKFSLMTELFERGSKAYSKEQLSEKTDLLASDLEGYSGRNTFGLKMLGPSVNMKELVPIFSDVLANPLFLEAELDIAKSDTISYLNRKKQNYAALASDKFFELLFDKHPYSLNQYGTEESVSNINKADIISTYKDFMFNDNVLLSAVGNFNLDNLVNLLEESFDISNQKNDLIKDNSFEPIIKDSSVEIKLGDKQQSHIMIGTYAPNTQSKDRFAFQIINSALSGMGGRLFLELRDKKSLAYTVSSFFSSTLEYGYFGIYIGCSPEKKEESIAAINSELLKLVNNGLTEEEIMRSKNYLIGKNDISFQRNSSVNARISQAFFYDLGLNEPFDFSSNIMNVSKKSINSAIESYLRDAVKVSVSIEPS